MCMFCMDLSSFLPKINKMAIHYYYFILLRVLHVITAYFALTATLQNYISSETMKKAHALEAAQLTYLASRIQCMFTLLSCFCRMSLALDIYNKTCYYLAMSTYSIVLFNVYMELNTFKTATLGPNMPSIVISSVMLPLLVIGLFLWEDKPANQADNTPNTVEDNKKTR